MSSTIQKRTHVCIACGGTGGHLFPGIAVGGKLLERGCEVTLVISPKEVDQAAVKNLSGMRLLTLPAVGLVRGGRMAFVRGFVKSYRLSAKFFRSSSPSIVLAMGGFTSAPPLVAARRFGARAFLHESNSVPGRANRWLSWLVTEAFVGFPSAAERLRAKRIRLTGTPVRKEFVPGDTRRCRAALGFNPDQPVILVMGGSQGAEGINRLVVESIPPSLKRLPDCQWLHIAGAGNTAPIQEAYHAAGLKAVVYGFMPQMQNALGAATVAISRAGASSLAELAAMHLPSILIPYPAATDNHQYWNARAFADTGAANLLEQSKANSAALLALLEPLLREGPEQAEMKRKVAAWHAASAAELIADKMLECLESGLNSHPEQFDLFGEKTSGNAAGRATQQKGAGA